MEKKGVTRRQFIKYAGATAALLGLSEAVIPDIAKALEELATTGKPPVIWLQGQNCSGCSVSFLNTNYPDAAEVVLDKLSVRYQPTVMAAAGYVATGVIEDTVEELGGKYVLVVEGPIPTAEGGEYCTFGLEKETKEIVQLLEAREQDHIKWVAELKRSVDDECEFTLARDPHQCAFGKWYDELMSDESRLQKLTNSNFTLYRLIGQLDTPHKTIHSIADRVTRFVRENDTEGAHRIIEVTSREELDTMVTLLNQIRELLHSLRKPVIIVLEAHDRQLGMQVDAVDSVVRIQPDQIQPIPDRLGNSELFSGVSQLKDEEGLLMMLDGTTLFSDSSVADDTITQAAPRGEEAAANSRPDRSQGRTLAIAQ